MQMDEAYLRAAADAIGLAIAPEYLAGVAVELARIAAIAEFVTAFPLDQSVEAAPVFKP